MKEKSFNYNTIIIVKDVDKENTEKLKTWGQTALETINFTSLN